MDTGFNPTNAASIEVAILATEIAVLALFPAISQIISQQSQANLFAGYSAGRRFNFIIYTNVAAILFTCVGLCISSLCILGWIGQMSVIYAFFSCCVTFILLAIVLAIVVSVQVVKR